MGYALRRLTAKKEMAPTAAMTIKIPKRVVITRTILIMPIIAKIPRTKYPRIVSFFIAMPHLVLCLRVYGSSCERA